MSKSEQKKGSDRIIFVIVVLFLIAGIAAFLFIKNMHVPNLFSKSEITMEQVQKIKKGMDMLKVREILGAPDETGSATMLDYDGVVNFYQNSSKDLQVNIIFKDDKVEMMTVNQDVIDLKP